MQIQTLDSTLNLNISSVSLVDATVARRAANRYLSQVVGIPFGAIAGVFIPLATPIWQFAIEFRLPRLGRLGIMGTTFTTLSLLNRRLPCRSLNF